MRTILRASLLCLLPTGFFGACSNSSGGGGPSQPQISASVPDGTGAVSIAMAGTWMITDPVIEETNDPSPQPPVDGADYVFTSDRIDSLLGFALTPANLQILFGPLDTYVNQIDGSTVLYGFVADNRDSGGLREEVAVAGGSVDANTIRVDAYSSSQGPNDPEPTFVRASYVLVRFPADVPSGTGTDVIDMPGTWTITDPVIKESNASNPVAPLAGTPFVLASDRVVSILGLSVDPAALAALLGPLESYVNRVDGRRVFYSVIVDNRATGGAREEIAVAGGSQGPDTVLVESYSSTQGPNDTVPIFVRSSYRLVRAPASPVVLEGASAGRTMLLRTFGGSSPR